MYVNGEPVLISYVIFRRFCVLAIVGVLTFSLVANGFAMVTEMDAKIGAYYYIWWGIPFNNHWEHGVKYTPFLGEYNSSDSLTADRHILWAKQHGIDFFAVSWIGKGTWVDWMNTSDGTWDFDEIDWNLNYSFLKASHLPDFNFCLFYETEIVLDNAIGHNKNFTDIFINDMVYAAENYFNHPSYLRVDNKPVLIIYNLPHLYQKLSIQEAQKLINVTRQRLADINVNVYLIGDLGGGPSAPDADSPLWYSLDAVTSYFFAHAHAPEGWQQMTDYARTYYPRWLSTAKSKGIGFIPNAYPGYDNTEHCKWKQSQNMSCTSIELPLNKTMFEQMLNIALNNRDENLKIVMITSWNEWLESTAIEPSMQFGESFLHTISNAKKVQHDYSIWNIMYFTAGVGFGVITTVIFYYIKMRAHKR